MGIAWILIGAMMGNFGLTTTGAVFTLIGVINKEEWDKEKKEWQHLSKKEKKGLIQLITVLAITFIIGLIVYLLISNGFV